MAKVKGIKKLNKALKKAFKPFGDINMRLATDYGYYPTDDTIEYRLTEGHIEDVWFNQFVKDRFGYKVKNTFMFSILHEIGHYYTLEEIRDCDIMYDFCEDEKARIQEEMQTANERQSKKLEWQYFNLPDEIAATAWAVKYATENAEEVEEIWQNVLKAIHKFYAKNITEESCQPSSVVLCWAGRVCFTTRPAAFLSKWYFAQIFTRNFVHFVYCNIPTM